MSETTPHLSTRREASPEELEVQVVDISDGVRDAAHEYADAFINEKTSQEGFKGFVKKIWYGNVARDYYHLREKRRAEERIHEGQNIYAMLPEQADDTHSRTVEAVTRRFMHEYDLLHRSAGETNSILDEATEEGATVKTALTTLIERFAHGEIDEDGFKEERVRTIQELARNDPRLMGEGLMYADNLLEIAQTVKVAVESGRNTQEMLDAITVRVGKGAVGSRTEANYSQADKILEKLQSTKVGSLVNETTLAAAVGATYSAARWGFSRATAALTAVPLVSAPAAALAGMRESKRFKDDRTTHSREMTYGKSIETGSERRDQMEVFRYESKSAPELIENIAGNLSQLEEEQTEAQQEATLDSVAEAMARIRLSDQEKIDLIHYSSRERVEEERFELDVAIHTAKVRLEELFGTDDITPEIDKKINSVFEVLGEDIEQKNALFEKARKRSVAKMALQGAVIGGFLGTAVQEVVAHLRPDELGLLETLGDEQRASGEPVHESLLRGLFGGGVEEFDVNSELHDVAISETSTVSLPEGFNLLENDDGSFNLVYGDGDEARIVTKNITFNDDGSLTESARSLLSLEGIAAEEDIDVINEEAVTEKTVGAEQLVENHRDEFTSVARELWYDNNTPAPVFDLNELGLHWGEAGSGIDEDGNFIFSVGTMTEDGSFHGPESSAWRELAAEGNLQIALSASEGTQTEALMIDINTDGTAVIEADSTAASLFSVEDGQAVFKGHYAEVAELTSVKEDGTQGIRLLATHLGEGSETFTDTVTTVTEESNYNYVFTVPAGELDTIVDVPPIIPTAPRKGLEKLMIEAEDIVVNPYYIGRSAETIPDEFRETIRERLSPRLRNNPNAVLDPKVEVADYISRLPEDERAVVQELAAQTERRKQPPKVYAAIPVAGHQEAANIYHTLDQYTQQTADTSSYELVLFVNHPEEDATGNPLNADAALAEIDRFKQDYPATQVSVLYRALPRSEAKIGKIRKYLTDAILMQAHQRGQTDDDFIIVSNDADAVEVSPRYFENFLERMENEELTDSFLGHIDWDYRDYSRYPQVHVGTRYMQMIDLAHRMRFGEVPSSGANFAFRASSYAAIGGYMDEKDVAEDVALGQALRVAREDAKRHEPIAHAGIFKSRVMTSARRAVMTHKKHGDAPANQWAYGFGADDEARLAEEPEVDEFDFEKPEAVAKVIADIEHFINRTNRTYYRDIQSYAGVTAGGEQAIPKEVVDAVIGKLGLEFEWEDDKVKMVRSRQTINALKRMNGNIMRKLERMGYASPASA